jgi:chromosome segregation ATPase
LIRIVCSRQSSQTQLKDAAKEIEKSKILSEEYDQLQQEFDRAQTSLDVLNMTHQRTLKQMDEIKNNLFVSVSQGTEAKTQIEVFQRERDMLNNEIGSLRSSLAESRRQSEGKE